MSQPSEKADKFFNQQNWPELNTKIMKACDEIIAKYGRFKLTGIVRTAKANEVIKYLDKVAKKHELKTGHLFNVYFGL